MNWMARSGLFSESYVDSFALTSKFRSGKARVGLKNPFSMLDHESMTCKFFGGAVVTKRVLKTVHS